MWFAIALVEERPNAFDKMKENNKYKTISVWQEGL